MTKCTECQGVVSEQAAACPHCGHPWPSAAVQTARFERRTQWQIIIGLPIVFLVLGMFSAGIDYIFAHFWRVILPVSVSGMVVAWIWEALREERTQRADRKRRMTPKA
ncbi:MAG TPA: hypothetical protein VG916_13045 [Gemmatimonadaceae bacterium]|nr:hypothetical protein [Gemmatimonadaceae bacterium]